MAKTAKAKPTAKDTKTKKSTSRKRTVKGTSNANELLSSPKSRAPNGLLSSPKSRAERAAHRSALLNPTEVDDPALSAVNPTDTETGRAPHKKQVATEDGTKRVSQRQRKTK